MKLSSTFCTCVARVHRLVHAFADGGAIAVAGADDVADAVLVAVDGEFIGGCESAALIAQVGEHLLVDGSRAARRCTVGGGDRLPPAAVVVGEGFARVDQVVPSASKTSSRRFSQWSECQCPAVIAVCERSSLS